MQDGERVEEEEHYLVSSGSKSRLARRKRRHTIFYVTAVVVISILFFAGLGLGLWYGELIDEFHASSSSDDKSSGTYQHAAVATDSAQCSKVGVDILKNNGSAVDAAIASLLCVGVINCHSTGIGGGGFMIYYNATNKSATVFDYRETAPGKANSSMYKPFGPNETASLYGVCCVFCSYYIHTDGILCRWSCYCSTW